MTGLKFKRIIPERDADKVVEGSKVRKLIFCSGQVYYDLKKRREEAGNWDTAIVTVEQLFPFPYDHANRLLDSYPNAEILWVQEEQKNAGAWTFIQPRVNSLLRYNGNREQ